MHKRQRSWFTMETAAERIPKNVTFSRLLLGSKGLHVNDIRDPLCRCTEREVRVHHGGTCAAKTKRKVGRVETVAAFPCSIDAQDPGHPITMSQRVPDFKACDGRSGQKPQTRPPSAAAGSTVKAVSVVTSRADHDVRFPVNHFSF